MWDKDEELIFVYGMLTILAIALLYVLSFIWRFGEIRLVEPRLLILLCETGLLLAIAVLAVVRATLLYRQTPILNGS